MTKAVPKGYKENWKYTGRWSEKKIRKGLWRFRFKATKKRKAKSYGSFKKGFQILWKINGYQKAKKTGKGIYQTDFIGYKRPIKAGYKLKRLKKRKW